MSGLRWRGVRGCLPTIYHCQPIDIRFGTAQEWVLPALQGQQTFSIKDQIVNTLGFAIHSVSMVTTQLDHCSRKAAAKCCVSTKPYLQRQTDTAFSKGKRDSFLFRSFRTFQQSLTVC